jgi:hypothetical protein
VKYGGVGIRIPKNVVFRDIKVFAQPFSKGWRRFGGRASKVFIFLKEHF